MLCLRFYFGKGEIVVAVRREEKSRLSLAIVIASEAKQSRMNPRRYSGLLRRLRSSQ